MIAATGSLRLVDELVRLHGLPGHDPHGVLEDVALSLHRPMLRLHEDVTFDDGRFLSIEALAHVVACTP
jgi:hypothetical protein